MTLPSITLTSAGVSQKAKDLSLGSLEELTESGSPQGQPLTTSKDVFKV